MPRRWIISKDHKQINWWLSSFEPLRPWKIKSSFLGGFSSPPPTKTYESSIWHCWAEIYDSIKLDYIYWLFVHFICLNKIILRVKWQGLICYLRNSKKSNLFNFLDFILITRWAHNKTTQVTPSPHIICILTQVHFQRQLLLFFNNPCCSGTSRIYQQVLFL